VQIVGNSSLTKRQAPASSKGPEVIPTLIRVSSFDSSKKDMRSPQLYSFANVFHTSSVHLSHPHRDVVGGVVGAWTGAWTGAGKTGGVGVKGPSIGARVGLEVICGESSSSPPPQVHVQIVGNSSLTKRQAPASSKGPEVIPTLIRVSSFDSSKKDMRSPQLYSFANVFHTSSVHLSHPHRDVVGGVVGAWTGAWTGACTTGAGTTGGVGVKLSGLRITLP